MKNYKEEIIDYLKQYKFLENIDLDDESDQKDYNNFITLYYKWCKFLEYPINYTSLYYFLSDQGHLHLYKIENKEILTLRIVLEEREIIRIYDAYDGCFYNYFYDRLMKDDNYSKL